MAGVAHIQVNARPGTRLDSTPNSPLAPWRPGPDGVGRGRVGRVRECRWRQWSGQGSLQEGRGWVLSQHVYYLHGPVGSGYPAR